MFQILQYNNFLSLYSFIGNTDWTGITINQRYHWMQYVVFVFYIIYAVSYDWIKKEIQYYKFYTYEINFININILSSYPA